MFLLFANSCIGSGTNRPRVLIHHSRKYPRLIGILFFILIFEMHYVRHSLHVFTRAIEPRLASPNVHPISKANLHIFWMYELFVGVHKRF